jgi:hypothetical protein
MKIRRISERQGKIHFPDFDSHYEKYLTSFYETDLGSIYKSIPWDNLVKGFGLKDNKKGPDSIFSPKGKLALMFLKNYTCSSDKKLIEQLNGNIYHQIFCDMIMTPGHRITNYKIVSQIRCELSSKLAIESIEKILMDSWKPYMNNLESITCDATCYESSIKYPTDVKLLFDSVQWIYNQILSICKRDGLRKPRTKYIKWVKRSISYSKMKKKRKVKRRSVTRGLLRLLTKLVGILDDLEQEHGNLNTKKSYMKRRATIRTILDQQGGKFYESKKPFQAIVSIDKPHIRPIVRGKENKSVEFGAKLHKLQIDGISFIEHLSFEAFNEGTRLKKTIWRAQKLTNKKVKILGADSIYATNANRKYVTQRNIQTDFKAKGRPGRHKEHKSQIAKMITKERASRLEGSFGTDKEYFLLNKIKARTKESEILWIFFGIHTSNALKIGKKMNQATSIAA